MKAGVRGQRAEAETDGVSETDGMVEVLPDITLTLGVSETMLPPPAAMRNSPSVNCRRVSFLRLSLRVDSTSRVRARKLICTVRAPLLVGDGTTIGAQPPADCGPLHRERVNRLTPQRGAGACSRASKARSMAWRIACCASRL